MAFPTELLPRVFAFAPTHLPTLCQLRVVSRNAKDRVAARWWQENVRCIKAFADEQAVLFGEAPMNDDEEMTLEERTGVCVVAAVCHLLPSSTCILISIDTVDI